MLPIDALADPSLRAPWSWQAVTIGRSLAAVEPSMARDGRVVQLVDGGAEALAAVAIGARIRRLSRRRRAPVRPRRRRSRRHRDGAARRCRPARAADPGQRRAAVRVGRLGRPRHRARSRPVRAARAVRPAAVLGERRGQGRDRDRGRDAAGARRAGPQRAAVRRDPRRSRPVGPPPPPGRPARDRARDRSTGDDSRPPTSPADRRPASPTRRSPPPSWPPGRAGRRSPRVEPTAVADAAPDPVERLLALIRDELARADHPRLSEIEPGRWWLAETADRDAAAAPLADRVEWAVFSLLSTAGPLSETRVLRPHRHDVHRPRPARRDARPGVPRQLPQPGQHARPARHRRRPAASQPGAHRAARRARRGRPPAGHARLAGGARAGPPSRRGHARRPARRSRARAPTSAASAGRPTTLAEVDAIWYIRGKVALLFEVEWTAMLGEPLLRRHARIGDDERLVRFLVVAPERTDLVRHKLERSPLLRAGDGRRRLEHPQVGPPADVPRRRAPGPRRPRAAARPGPASSSAAASRCRCSAADRGAPAVP